MKKSLVSVSVVLSLLLARPHAGASRAIVDVSTVPQLQAAVASLTSGTTIRIAPGRYALTQELNLNNVTNVALVGATGVRDDVVIVGSGMTTFGVNVAIKVSSATDVRISDLSVGEAVWHPIQLKGELGAERVHISNVRLFDAGQQFLKSTVDFQDLNGVDDVLVENSLFEYTVIGPADGYTQGIDASYAANWIIRHNVFRNIHVPATAIYLNRPAILMWNGSRNSTVYGNTIIDCERGVIFGQDPKPEFAHNHTGGAIYNNVIYRTRALNADSGISVWDSPGTRVYHNTVIQNGTYPTAIEYRFAGTTGVEIINNLTDGAILQRDGASALVSNNYTQALPSFFVNPSAFDLHLSRAATPVLDTGVTLSLVTDDIDGERRPSDTAPELGADEFYPWRIADPPPAVLAAPAHLAARASGSSVQLTWSDRSTDESGYVVERQRDRRDGFQTVAVLGPETRSYVDAGLSRGPYRYRVKAIAGALSSPWSNLAAVVVR
jgi:hypothetical protein